MEGRILVRILLLIAAAERSGVAAKRYQPWSLPPLNRNPHPNKPAVLDHCEHIWTLVSSRGGSSEDWYERAARRQKDRYYPEERQRSDDDYDNDNPYGEADQGGGYADDYYGDQRPTPNRKEQSSGGLLSSVPTSLLRGDRKTGLMLLGSGLAVTFLGISLFFNRTLLRLGNLMFIAGVTMTLGPSRTFGYFIKPEKFRATACLGLGIFLVFMGSPVFGMLLEFFGLLNLFGNMFPMVWMMAKNLPILGPILKTTSGEGAPRRRKERYDDPPTYRYEDEDGYTADNNDQSYQQSGQQSGQQQQSYGQGGYDNNEWDDNPGETPPSRYY